MSTATPVADATQEDASDDSVYKKHPTREPQKGSKIRVTDPGSSMPPGAEGEILPIRAVYGDARVEVFWKNKPWWLEDGEYEVVTKTRVAEIDQTQFIMLISNYFNRVNAFNDTERQRYARSFKSACGRLGLPHLKVEKLVRKRLSSLRKELSGLQKPS